MNKSELIMLAMDGIKYRQQTIEKKKSKIRKAEKEAGELGDFAGLEHLPRLKKELQAEEKELGSKECELMVMEADENNTLLR